MGPGKGEFAELILIASPHMLGMLRDEFSPESARRVALSLAQDLMHLDGCRGIGATPSGAPPWDPPERPVALEGM